MRVEVHPIKAILVILLFVAFYPVEAYSQQEGTCAEKLKTAQVLFEKGQIELVPEYLSGCLKSDFSREESLTAYKLLIQSYLFMENQKKADSVMLAFLGKNPEYMPSPTDHSGFVSLYNNFRIKKLIQFSIHLGSNLPFISTVKKISASGNPGDAGYSTDALNIFGSLEAKYAVNDRLEFNIEAGYSKLSFSNRESFLNPENTAFGVTTYSENQTRIDLPLSITYDIKRFGDFTAYCRLGAGPSFILNSYGNASHVPADINNPYSRTGADIDRRDSRRSFDLFVMAGAGIKFKIREG
ncbi:MAG TPA: outer membrane beta-barrel protein, partial [Bacteroidales bacterium]|nr:outer membrane beta-barrel protein [Bacteroidales bacterium]